MFMVRSFTFSRIFQNVMLEWAYSLIHGMTKHAWDADVELFLRIISGEVRYLLSCHPLISCSCNLLFCSEYVHLDQMLMVSQLKSVVKEAAAINAWGTRHLAKPVGV